MKMTDADRKAALTEERKKLEKEIITNKAQAEALENELPPLRH